MSSCKEYILLVEPIDFAALHLAYMNARWKWGLGRESHIPAAGEIADNLRRLTEGASTTRFCESGGMRVELTAAGREVFLDPGLAANYFTPSE